MPTAVAVAGECSPPGVPLMGAGNTARGPSVLLSHPSSVHTSELTPVLAQPSPQSPSAEAQTEHSGLLRPPPKESLLLGTEVPPCLWPSSLPIQGVLQVQSLPALCLVSRSLAQVPSSHGCGTLPEPTLEGSQSTEETK